MKHLRSRHQFEDRRASVLVMCLILITVLSLIGSAALFTVTSKCSSASQAASWAEPLAGAEAGVSIALTALKKNDWTGWTVSGGVKTYVPSPLVHGGEGNNSIRISVRVDAPAGLSDSSGQWYRIRSTGTADVPGPVRLSTDKRDNDLRRMSLRRDRITNTVVSSPRVSRVIEVLAKPQVSSPWIRALTLKGDLAMSGGGWIDSFDSSDSSKSTGGLYDVTKRQSNGDVGINWSASSDLKSTYVYGDLSWSNKEPANDINVQGAKSSPFNQVLPPVSAPTWTTFNASPNIIGSTMTLTGGPQGSPQRYKVSSLNVPGGNVLTFAPHTAGAESYVEVWVTGKFTTSGSGYITQQPGVHVTYYVEGDTTVSGSSFSNQSNLASNLTFYGVSPTDGSTRKFTVSGGGNFIGTVNAPAFNATFSGSANFSGSFIFNTANISGGASVHYDEALANGAGGSGTGAYLVASWFEDNR